MTRGIGTWGAIALLVLPMASWAEGEPLRVALSGNYMPLHGSDRSGRVGLEAELALALGRELGREVEFVDTQRRFKLDTLKAVAEGKVDVSLNSITPTPERAQLVDFTRPYLKLSYRLAGRKGGISTEKLRRLVGRVAVPSAAVRDAVEAALPEATAVDCEGLRQCIRMVEEGQADFVAYEDVGLHLAVRGSPLVVSEATFGRSPLAIATPKGGAAIIDAALEKLGPTLERLRREWKPGTPSLLDSERALLERLPGRLLVLVRHEGEWVRPRYCYSQTPALGIEQTEDGGWQLHAVLAQDTDIHDIQSIQKTGEKAYRLKVVMPYTREPTATLLELKPGEEPGTWQCDACHPHGSTFTTRAQAKKFRVHDFDANNRDASGSCGPP
ncbi:amino acid ABC transporter substrate-binding protein [Archangium violaceum]|uniref:substrate-binding periplasmic protein n=1 Tax=Archangium violaceum TaxID=83451 RepID=UPI00193C643D|nr:transporter substrate-binding domain-containing protein [Archangium violaceum]QRK10789.1 amino acid ABC transporter substrate-binding protein [Archangium violaceum]